MHAILHFSRTEISSNEHLLFLSAFLPSAPHAQTAQPAQIMSNEAHFTMYACGENQGFAKHEAQKVAFSSSSGWRFKQNSAEDFRRRLHVLTSQAKKNASPWYEFDKCIIYPLIISVRMSFGSSLRHITTCLLHSGHPHRGSHSQFFGPWPASLPRSLCPPCRGRRPPLFSGEGNVGSHDGRIQEHDDWMMPQQGSKN